MITYQHMSQLVKTFDAGEELLDLIKAQSNNSKIRYINHLGIQCRPGEFFYLDGELIEMGKTGIYELQEDMQVKSIQFAQPTKAIIDFAYVI